MLRLAVALWDWVFRESLLTLESFLMSPELLGCDDGLDVLHEAEEDRDAENEIRDQDFHSDPDCSLVLPVLGLLLRIVALRLVVFTCLAFPVELLPERAVFPEGTGRSKAAMLRIFEVRFASSTPRVPLIILCGALFTSGPSIRGPSMWRVPAEASCRLKLLSGCNNLTEANRASSWTIWMPSESKLTIRRFDLLAGGIWSDSEPAVRGGETTPREESGRGG